MIQQIMNNRNMLIKSDKITEIIVKILLSCSMIIVGCEIYLLLKL